VFEHLRRARRGVRGGVEPPARGFGGSAPEIFFLGRHISGRHITGTTYFRDNMIFRWFIGTWFFADGFLFPVKELGFWTNPGHWVRVLDAAGSYMYIVL
jgi:hypothetical protein